MGYGDLWSVLIASVFALVIFGGLFRLKKVVRNQLFPEMGEKGRGQAMAELMLLQARLQEDAKRDGAPEEEE